MRACLVLASLVLFLFNAQTQAAEVGLDPARKSIVMPLTEPQTIDPQRCGDAFGGIILNMVMEGLVRADRDEKPIPAMAETWKTESPTRYTFKLRKGALWSDGKPVTAQDFVYGWRRGVDPKTASPSASSFYVVKNGMAINTGKAPVETLGISATDDHTLVVDLESPTPYFLHMLSGSPEFYPTRKDVVEAKGEKFAADADTMVYNGPFTVSAWSHSASLTMTKRDTYWNAAEIGLNEIKMVLVPDHRTALTMVQTGMLAMVRSMPTHLAREAAKAKLNVRSYNHGSIYHFAFNTKSKSLAANQHVRKAIQLALNRKEFVEQVEETPGAKAYPRIVPDYMPGVKTTYVKEHPVAWPDAQLDKAKAELAAARKELGVETLPPLTIMCSDSEVVRRDVEYFQAYLKTSIGLELKIDQQAFKVTLDRGDRGDFEMALYSSGPTYLDPMTYLSFYSSYAPGYSIWSAPEYDELIRKASAEADPAKRFALLFDAEKMLVDAAPIVPIMQSTRLYVIDPRLTGVLRRVAGADPDFYFAKIEPKLATVPKR